MEFSPIVLEGFNGRDEALSRIKRYAFEFYKIMYYRTNDLLHSRRVLWHLEEAIPNIQTVYGDKFDVDFARTLALVHDDAEIITGDVALHEKEKMTEAGLKLLARKECKAIQIIIKMYNETANGYSYEKLLTAAKDKVRLEAQFVSFFDKFDGAGESWHEAWAGNRIFLRPSAGTNKTNGGYVRRLNTFPQKYPDMIKFFEKFPEYLPEPFNFNSVVERGRPHTAESLKIDSGYIPYERWKKIIIKREGIENLVRQVEF